MKLEKNHNYMMQKITVATLVIFFTCSCKISALPVSDKMQRINEFAVGLEVLDAVIHNFTVGYIISMIY